jgi:hypothetical protein
MGMASTITITPVIANGNAYMASAQRRKAERLFGILQTAGIETEDDFALVDDKMWSIVASIAQKEYPSPTVREMVRLMYERN